MKKLGLIGGTGPESTMIYYHDIVYGVQKKVGGAVFPNLTIESLNVFDVLRFCDERDYGGLVRYLLRGFDSLAGAGAECAALTGITPHIVFDELAERSPIPLISMVETSYAFARDRGYKKIALLGTAPTMNGTFFQKPFTAAGIDVITPTEDEKRFIGTKIETELEHGLIVPETQRAVIAISRRLIAEDGAEAIVLGCTELPLIFSGTELPVPFIDVMRVHIDTLIDTIVG